MMTPLPRIFSTALVFTIGVFSSRLLSQEFDGSRIDHASLADKDAVLQPSRGQRLKGKIERILLDKSGFGIDAIEFNENRRIKKYKPAVISALEIDGRPMSFIQDFPNKRTLLVDTQLAHAEVDRRLEQLNYKRTDVLTREEFNEATRKSIDFATNAVEKLGTGITMVEGEEVVLVTDFQDPLRKNLLKLIDVSVTKMNKLCGFEEEDYVLPGKIVIGAFGQRSQLGKFQSEVVGDKNYGDYKSHYYLVNRQFVVGPEDNRSLNHLHFQIIWGIAGVYLKVAHSDVKLPEWMQTGMQQHCCDVMVPGVSNHQEEKKVVATELRSGFLNNLLAANRLEGDRQLVAKLVCAHLYRLNPIAFSQTFSLLKSGRTTDEVLAMCYGMTQGEFATSFGKSIGVPNLVP